MYIDSTVQLLLDHSEPEVAAHFNISTAVLRQYRGEHLFQDAEFPGWYRGKHNKVYFTPVGLSLIMEWLGLKVALEGAVEVTVLGFAINPHILKCVLDDGNIVNVKVRSHVGFLKGMRLSVSSDAGSPVLYYKGPNPVNPKLERHFYKV